jgi:hypothetical protein
MINRSTECHFEFLAILENNYAGVSKLAENIGLYSGK